MHKTDPQVWSLAFQRKHTTSIPCTVLARKSKKMMMLEEENYTRYIAWLETQNAEACLPFLMSHSIQSSARYLCQGVSVALYLFMFLRSIPPNLLGRFSLVHWWNMLGPSPRGRERWNHGLDSSPLHWMDEGSLAWMWQQ
jgi:hypothetical protein